MSELNKGEADDPKAQPAQAADTDAGDGDQGEQADTKPPKSAKPPDEVKLSKKEHEALLKRIDEAEQASRYWHEQTKAKPEAEAEGKPESEPDDDEVKDDTTDKFIDDLSKSGIAALVRRGVLTKKAAREIIEKEARKIAREVAQEEVGAASKRLTTDAKLVQQFPDLQDKESEHFQRTGAIYREMVADDPALKNSPGALFLAARTAKAELAAEGKGRSAGDRDATIRAQAGDRGGGRDTDVGGELIGPQARELIAAFKIDEAGYKRHMGRVR